MLQAMAGVAVKVEMEMEHRQPSGVGDINSTHRERLSKLTMLMTIMKMIADVDGDADAVGDASDEESCCNLPLLATGVDILMVSCLWVEDFRAITAAAAVIAMAARKVV